ncbi:MAG: hypothetical protein ACRDRR_03430 [Pseudonocardiaceae bacterium]
MPTTLERGIDPAASTTPMPRVGTPLQLSPRTVAWLADHPHARELVRSVWDELARLERAGQHPGTIDALRVVLVHHQPPTAAGRCRTCRRFTCRHLWRRPPFPCIVWHQIHGELLGAFAGRGHHRSQRSPLAERL